MFQRMVALLCLAIGLGWCQISPAAEPPAPAQTTAPAAPDLSTPRATARSLYLASHTGDAAAVRNIFYASNDGERQLCDCFAELLAAGGKLEEALRAKYGQGDASFAAPMMTQSDLAKLDSAKLEEDGDSAQLTPAGESRPMKFKRVDGQWKLIVSDYAGATKENLPEQIETLTSMARVFEGAAADVAAGKYPNASDAEAGIQQKLYDLIVAAVQKTPPTSAPATRP